MKGGNLSRIILTQLDMSKPKSTNGTRTAQQCEQDAISITIISFDGDEVVEIDLIPRSYIHRS